MKHHKCPAGQNLKNSTSKNLEIALIFGLILTFHSKVATIATFLFKNSKIATF